jgi:hypothetical protein
LPNKVTFIEVERAVGPGGVPCGDPHAAAPAERIPLIRRTLAAVVNQGDTYLDSDLAVEAIVAAAIVAAQLPGGAPVTSSYAPDFRLTGCAIEVPEDVPPLALRALDRIVGDNSEWRSLWAESPALYAQVLAALHSTRVTLEQAVS